jgi:hypothetical protein
MSHDDPHPNQASGRGGNRFVAECVHCVESWKGDNCDFC